MKKLIAVITVLVLSVSLFAFGVSAEGFTFREISRSNNDTEMQIVWNWEELNVPNEEVANYITVRLGGTARPISFDPLDPDNTMLVDLSGLDAGIYPVVYEYVSGDVKNSIKAKDFIFMGEAEVTLTLSFNEDGTVTVTARNASGMPVPRYQLKLTIGAMSGVTGVTDSQGKYTSFLSLDYGQSVTYAGLQTIDSGITYAATNPKSLVRQPPATTAPPTWGTTTGTEPTTETTTDTTDTTGTTDTTDVTTTPTTVITTMDPDTIYTVLGTGTTAVKKEQIVINASTDTGVLAQFGCTEEEFIKRARLYLDEKDYAAMTGRNKSNMLMINVLTAEQVLPEQLRVAVNGVDAYAKYSDEECKALTFGLSFLILDKSGSVIPVTAMPLDSEYIVELPVPESMRKCKELAITVKDGNGLMTPQKVSVSGGTFKLQINSMESYTLIGFGSGGGGGLGIWQILGIILLIILALVLVVIVLLMVLYMVRRSAKKAPPRDEETPTIVVTQMNDNDSDIYSGRTDLPDDKE